MINFADERDLQRKIARKLSTGDFNFQVAPANYFCDVIDAFNNIYIEVKPSHFAACQLLYGAFRTFGGNEYDFIPQVFGLATASEIQFYKVPPYSVLKDFYNSIDSTVSPSLVGNAELNRKAREILGAPFCTNNYDSPLDFTVPYIFISPKNIFYVITRLERYDINIKELISKIADVYINKGEIALIKSGGIVDTVDGSVVASKRIKPEDEHFVKSLRITPHDITELSDHLDEYEEISKRRSLGQFYTKPHTTAKVHDLILKHINPSVIVDPYSGTGSLLVPFAAEGVKIIGNDIDPNAIAIAKLQFEGYDAVFDNIDCISVTAAELIRKWGLSGENLFYFNPPFGTVATNTLVDDGVDVSRKIAINYRDELLQYGRGDLILPTIGQTVEMMKILGSGYLAFYCPAGIFLGRRRYNKLLKELLSNFTFLEGLILSGDDFNEVSGDKPIALTLWKFGGSTNHLDLKFDCYDKTVELQEGFFLKDGWRYDQRDGIEGELCVAHKEVFNVPQPPMFHCKPKGGGSRVIPANVKADISFNGFPSELIYSLWSTISANPRLTVPVATPLQFNEAYTHMPRDFNNKECQLILTYLILWNLLGESNHNYTNNWVGFVGIHRRLRFGTPEQTSS
jgi:hypothetical protein